jgi:hypothetical protein
MKKSAMDLAVENAYPLVSESNTIFTDYVAHKLNMNWIICTAT